MTTTQEPGGQVYEPAGALVAGRFFVCTQLWRDGDVAVDRPARRMAPGPAMTEPIGGTLGFLWHMATTKHRVGFDEETWRVPCNCGRVFTPFGRAR